jgi:adenine-specific DNA-methyltransferase
MFDVAKFGQVFTPNNIVELMIDLRQNLGRVLEPSSGDGAFSSKLLNCVSIEIDPKHAHPGTLVMDFFDFSSDEKFDTIIGNPPYVRYQDIPNDTKIKLNSQLFDSRSNLYLFFIEKSLDHLNENGELIFIVPRDFLKSTSSVNLNRYLYSRGTITHLIDLGDSRVFTGAVPNCIIFRFQLGEFQREANYAFLNTNSTARLSLDELPWKKKEFQEISGQLIFTNEISQIRLRDIAEVRVGAVSGMDEIFASEEHGNRDFVFSETARTGKTRKMIWVSEPSDIPQFLFENKPRLIQRRIRQFDESNWWEWGRGYPENTRDRVYVNAKTRHKNPFFLHECKNFDGSVLALFPKSRINLENFVNDLNRILWDEYGFFCDGRFIFSQRSLENAPLPNYMDKYLNN